MDTSRLPKRKLQNCLKCLESSINLPHSGAGRSGTVRHFRISWSAESQGAEAEAGTATTNGASMRYTRRHHLLPLESGGGNHLVEPSVWFV